MTYTLRPITAELLASGCTTTVSNTGGAFYLVCAPLCGDYRQALNAVARNELGHHRSEQLCGVQLRMSARYECVKPEWCIRGDGYWYLRNTSNLGNTWPAGRGQYATLHECLLAAERWHAAAPDYREVVVYTSDLEKAGLLPEVVA